MKTLAVMVLLAGFVLMAFATPAFASIPVYHSDCITWTPAQPIVGQPVTFGLDPDFMASMGVSSWTTKNLVLYYDEVGYYPPFVFTAAGHYEPRVTVLFGTGYPWDDDGAGPNPAGYVHTFLSDVSFDVVPVPEPSALLVFTCGLGAVLRGIVRFKRR